MTMVCGLDLHRRQITFDAVEVEFGGDDAAQLVADARVGLARIAEAALGDALQDVPERALVRRRPGRTDIR